MILMTLFAALMVITESRVIDHEKLVCAILLLASLEVMVAEAVLFITLYTGNL